MKTVELDKNIENILKYLVKDILYNDLVNSYSSENKNTKPYILGITGSVSVGKSTMSRILQKGLKKYFTNKNISIITTDSFLYSNEILNNLGLMEQKGFPKTYDIYRLKKFFLDITFGIQNINIPVYSHFFQNIVPSCNKIVQKSDIFIIEGLHILNPYFYITQKDGSFYFSDFFNFSIYMDAKDEFLIEWYLNRFLRLRKISKFYPRSFFNFYFKMSLNDAINYAIRVWYKINYKNLKENIFFTKQYANLIINKNFEHEINYVKFIKFK
ncbi:MAG: type I pantothenate kinase [Buchnera aphidicola (Nurudea yanoniella)]